jgi:hypothetical protein
MKQVFALVLIFVLRSVCGQPVVYGGWLVTKDVADFQIAHTRTGNAETGVVCVVSVGNCSAFLGTDTPCTDGVKTPMLINSATGAYTVTATCTTLGKQKYNLFDEFGNVKAAYESGGVIGFAIPLKSGEFRVVRFDTRGATAAIRDAMTSPGPGRDSPTKSDVRL